ncbi:MAG: PQQ-binding-like beta-propeller repeat protein [bacterium]
MRNTAILLAAMLPFGHQSPMATYPDVGEVLPLRWKVQTGQTTFRSNVVFTPDRLYIGSNGNDLMDMDVYDPKSGVYAVDRRSGRKLAHFGGEVLGDMDVNGLVIHDGRIYFGNDNEEFICTDLGGRMIWRRPVSGDVEHEPTLLNINGRKAVAYATESGEVSALDALTGKTVWSYYLEGFNGWKPTNNRAVFKVKSFFRNTTSFYTKPMLHDINRDGVTDLIYVTYSREILALSGRSGKILWTLDLPTSHHFGGLRKVNGKTMLMLSKYHWDRQLEQSIVHEMSIGMNGKLIKMDSLENMKHGGSLNTLETDQGEHIIASRVSLFVMDKNGKTREIDRMKGSELIKDGYTYDTPTRNGYQPLLGNRVFRYGKHPRCVALLNQFDNGNSGHAFVEIISLSEDSVVKRFTLPSPSEFPPLIEDVDRDGQLDMLLSCNNGWLYCHRLKPRN